MKPVTKETREKMRQSALKNPTKYWLGKKMPPKSEEYRKKMSITKKGHSVSEETRRKLSIAHTGKVKPKGKDSPKWKGGYENKLMHNKKRRIMKLGNGGSHTLAEWELLKAQYNWTCPRCHKAEPKIKLSEDHVIPLSKGGSDNIENIQPLCKSCNCKKHNSIIPRY